MKVEKTVKILTVGFIVLTLLFFLILGIMLKVIVDQQRQINELNKTALVFIKGQPEVSDGTGIQMGIEYDVVYIDFDNEIAVLKFKGNDGKPHYSVFSNLLPFTLKEWSENRHFRG
jgi:hypothetical protein